MIVSDDDADLATILSGLRSLDPPPYVVACRTAGDALEALHTQPELTGTTMPFVILVEVNLPLVSGLEFVACMRCDAGLSRIPVFILTESSSDCEQFAAHDVRVEGYLQKRAVHGEAKAIAAQLAAYACGRNSPNRARPIMHGRTRVACLPRRAPDAVQVPESQRRSAASRAN